MNNWQEKKLGDFLTQKKREVIINPNTEYSLVTISNKGIIRLRKKKRGAEIVAKKAYLAKAGDFIYSRLAAHTGAFGIVGEELDNALVTGEMPCFEIDKRQALPDILTNMLNTPGVIWQLKQFTKGMGRVRIKENMMLSLSLLLPDVSEQKKLSKNIQAFKHELAQLGDEFLNQRELLAGLRRRILQDAIEGKLTADWRKGASRNYESAEVLLKRISQEKERLIKAGELKKQKPLPPIADNEKPFALPKGWAWCRLATLITKLSTGPFGTMLHKSDYVSDGIPLVNPANIVNGKIMPSKKMMVSESTKNRLSKYLLNSGDIVIARRGDLKCAVVGNGEAGYLCGTGSFFMGLQRQVSEDFFIKVYRSDFFQKQLLHASIGQTMVNLNHKILNHSLFPLPPLAEQRAIVAKVEKLLALCDSLQAEARNNEALAKRLMQAALKEAFTPPKN